MNYFSQTGRGRPAHQYRVAHPVGSERQLPESRAILRLRFCSSPRYVDVEKCIACGVCAEKCPKKVDDEYNEGLIKRKAIYVPYSQAVPLKYAIDADNCIYLNKGKCGACEKYCPSGAIDFNDTKRRSPYRWARSSWRRDLKPLIRPALTTIPMPACRMW